MRTAQNGTGNPGRTRLITLASVAAVAVAGAVAVGANLGILNRADDTKVGTVAASDLTAVTTPQVVEVNLGSLPAGTAPAQPTTGVPLSPSGTAAAGVQEFTVDVAGTVSVAKTASGIRLQDVVPAAGWTWKLTQPKATELTVSLTDGKRNLEFVAIGQADGTVVASVNEPIIQSQPATANSGGGHDEGEHDDEYEGGGDDD